MLAALEDARELAREAYRIFSDRGARLLAASIAFYALLSVVPILVIALAAAAAARRKIELPKPVQFSGAGPWGGSGLGSRTGYDLTDGVVLGWCARGPVRRRGRMGVGRRTFASGEVARALTSPARHSERQLHLFGRARLNR
ncbi:MAG: hypothetical protein KF718_20930 [Polyangiaceae bacterium]|nr:hypothetical protein [Polyangiaceae bacterium]